MTATVTPAANATHTTDAANATHTSRVTHTTRVTRAARTTLVAVALFAAACSAPAPTPDTRDSAGTTIAEQPTALLETASITEADSTLVRRADLGRIMGDSAAPIWIVMISDFQCPYCKQFHDNTLGKVFDTYVKTGKARFAYLHLPLPQHVNARPAARASLCASAQGKFWQYTDSVFAHQTTLEATANPAPLLSRIAQQLNLDIPSFDSCIRSPAIEQMVQIDEQQSMQAGVQSTPSFIVGDFLVQGAAPWEQFRQAVDTALVVARERAGPRKKSQEISN